MDPAWPRHLAGERQRVLGCQSIQVSGAGVESYAPSTEPGDGKGGAPLFSPSFGSFSWRSKKRTNILREPGPWRWENCLRAGRRKGPIRTVRPAGAFRSATAAMGGTWRKDRPLHDAALPRGGRQSIQNVPPACTKPSRFRLYPPFTTPLPPFGGSRTEKSLS